METRAVGSESCCAEVFDMAGTDVELDMSRISMAHCVEGLSLGITDIGARLWVRGSPRIHSHLVRGL